MIHFENDYSSGAAPEIMEALAATNFEGNTGYGFDGHTSAASARILGHCGCPEGDVFFLAGGTQTNAVALDWLCRRGEGILCSGEAHINVHESGAIEAGGHKVIPLPSPEGKIRSEDIKSHMQRFYADPTWPHMVRPGAVYISQPTELGTLYSLAELRAISEVCRREGLSLYLDGARLIYALASPANDVSLRDIAALTDMFYIGGTKAGTLFGEALVIPRGTDRNRFFSHIKRCGALLAKGWLTAVQFERLFIDDLYLRLGHRAIAVASRLRGGLLSLGYQEAAHSPTNQLFFALDEDSIRRLEMRVAIDIQHPLGEGLRLVRFVADWANTQDDADKIIELLKHDK